MADNSSKAGAKQLGQKIVKSLDKAPKGSGVRPLGHRTQRELGKVKGK